MNDDTLTGAVNLYINSFKSYTAHFLHWGEWFFYSAVTITIVWLCLWRAFDHQSFQDSMPKFLKEFFVLALFYTIMLNAGTWLGSIAHSADNMGTSLIHAKTDASSVIAKGIELGDAVLSPSVQGGLAKQFVGGLVCLIAYIAVLFVFISIALELAVAKIAIAFFIAISGLLLAFSAFEFTRAIARRTLDVVLSLSFKLLGLYVVVGAGIGVFDKIAYTFPQSELKSFDVLGWVIAATFLFYAISKFIPNQLARIFSEVIQETRGTDAAAIAVSAVKYASVSMAAAELAKNTLQKTARGVANITKVTGSAKSVSLASEASNRLKSTEQGTGPSLNERFKQLQTQTGKSLQSPEGKTT